MRGFESSMDYKMIAGVGNASSIDSVEVIWPGGNRELLKNVKPNQHIIFDYNNSVNPGTSKKKNRQIKPLLVNLPDPPFKHKENEYNEFNRERLLFHMLSGQGPGVAKGDINGDGLDDVYAGGARGQAGALLVQDSKGSFKRMEVPAFVTDSLSEDVDALFFDADNDRDLDPLCSKRGYGICQPGGRIKEQALYKSKFREFNKISQIAWIARHIPNRKLRVCIRH